MKLKRLIHRAVDTAMPPIDKCVVCGVEKGVADELCSHCERELLALKHGETTAKELDAFSVYKYDGAAGKIVRGYKYNGKRYLADFMAGKMAAAVPNDTGAICFVPLHKKRLRQRGFDQAELLADRIAKITGIPLAHATERTRNTITQTKLSQQQRRENMKDAFVACGQISGNVVLVDDVLTTGATAAECAAVLKGSGSGSVFVLTFARSLAASKKPALAMRLLRKIF